MLESKYIESPASSACSSPSMCTHECARQRVDQLGARVGVRPHGIRRDRKKFGVVRVEAPLGRRVVERLEPVRRRLGAGPLGKPHALILPDDGDQRLVTGAGKKELEPDAEDQRDAQQRRQRRKQPAALDFREQRRRQARCAARVRPGPSSSSGAATGSLRRYRTRSIPSSRSPSASGRPHFLTVTFRRAVVLSLTRCGRRRRFYL